MRERLKSICALKKRSYSCVSAFVLKNTRVNRIIRGRKGNNLRPENTMNANKFTSRYLPFDLFCAECEKLGERYVSRRDKGSALIPVGYFARRVENYDRLIKRGN